MDLKQIEPSERPFSDDVIRGMEKISEYVGEDERRCYYLAPKGLLPGVFKQGNQWIGLKSVIREAYESAARGQIDPLLKNPKT
jgi:hypothetical protein